MDILILGIGNSILSDEGVGVRVIDALAAADLPPGARAVDGGTIGLALLPLIESADAVVFVDAARMASPPGTVKVYEGAELDAFALRAARTPHDVGLHDLLDGLRLTESLPAWRALVGIEPGRLGLGADLTPAVADAVPRAAEQAREVAARWGS